MKILFLTRDLPYPAINGYKKRNFYLLKELAARKAEIILFSESSPNDTEAISYLKTYCQEVRIIKLRQRSVFSKFISAFLSLFSTLPFSVKARTSPILKREIQVYLEKNQIDIIICDAIYRSLNIPFNNKAVKILYEHNIESKIIERYVEMERNIFKKILACLEFIKLEVFQKKMWSKFDCCIACSSLDKRAIEEKARTANVFAINNGVDCSYFSSDSYPVHKSSLVYTGQIGWHPNEDALIYFLKNIYPLIKRDRPQANFWIVGGEPSGKLKLLTKNDKSVIITGFVEDVRPYIGEACVYVVPLRIGSGTRLKILEALSMQKAVVSTSVGCEGLDVENNKHLLIRDNPEEFAEAVVQLLGDGDRRINLGENGRRLVEERYDWNVVFGRLDEVLNKVKISGD